MSAKAKVKKIELNKVAVRETLLKGEEMTAYIEQLANEKISGLGEGYETNTYNGKNRVNVSLVATSEAAVKDNIENNTLLKAVSK